MGSKWAMMLCLGLLKRVSSGTRDEVWLDYRTDSRDVEPM